MNKLMIGGAVAVAVIGGLYAQGMLPWVRPEPGIAAPREAKAPAKAGERRAEPAATVSVVRAGKAQLKDTVLVTGTLVPRLEVLVAPEVEGLRVVELIVEEGDRVTKGQLLARLEQETLRVQLAQNDAARAKAQAAIAQARSSIVSAEARKTETVNALDRARPLSKSGVVSESTLDQREAAARTAIAQLQLASDGLMLSEAEAGLIEAQRRDMLWKMSRTEVRATVDGIISRRSARVGGVATGASVAQPMFHIIAGGQIELEGEIPEMDLARLKPDLEATVVVAGAGEVRGKVRLVAPEVDKATRQGRVRIALPDSAALRIGSFGRGSVTVSNKEGIAVPASAVLFGTDGAYIQLVENNRVVTRRVTTGLVTPDLVEVKVGVAIGDMLVAKAGTFLRAGDLVSPVEAREPRTN